MQTRFRERDPVSVVAAFCAVSSIICDRFASTPSPYFCNIFWISDGKVSMVTFRDAIRSTFSLCIQFDVVGIIGEICAVNGV